MSQVAGIDIVKRIGPDIVGHVTGGPIPMPVTREPAVVASAFATLYEPRLRRDPCPRAGWSALLVGFAPR